MTLQQALDPERRAALLGVKLRALVCDAFAATDAESLPFSGGAAMVVGASAYVLLDENHERSLGRALAWAQARPVDELHVLAEAGTEVLARRAGLFAFPVSVWRVEGRALIRAEPAPPAQPEAPPGDVESLAELLRAAGLQVVAEHGEIVGELFGLVVARIVVDDDSRSGVEAEPRLEVGVGRHDREAFALLHGDLPAAEALAAVVSSVAQHRRPGGDNHPLNRLAGQRWLRDLVRREPSLVGLSSLEPADAPLRPLGVKDPSAAIGVGCDPSGASVVAAFSTGIDLDVVPAAADARLMHAPGARLLVVLPERDAHAVTYRLASSLRDPA
ncbi:MAG: hypothetical protein N2037_06305, partial [Acidimicrobiales bacterium]|nr:hypothetical protein [Acidimicrobiales bacterium]